VNRATAALIIFNYIHFVLMFMVSIQMSGDLFLGFGASTILSWIVPRNKVVYLYPIFVGPLHYNAGAKLRIEWSQTEVPLDTPPGSSSSNVMHRILVRNIGNHGATYRLAIAIWNVVAPH
jgi:hypothetical protein